MFDELLALKTPPAFLKAYLDVYRKGMEKNVQEQFEETLHIGLANEKALTTHPAEWAQSILRMLIDENRYSVTLWIREVCGEPQCPDGVDASSVAWIQGQYWQAPRLILMEPSGTAAYDPGTAWTLEDVPHSQELLESHSATFTLLLGVYLKKIAGGAHVRLARSQQVLTSPTAASPRPSHLRAVDNRKELIARLKGRNPNANARKICEFIDKTIDKAAPIRRDSLAPLKSWQMQAPGKRSWVELYDHPKTRNRVRTYVNKVPALKTSRKPSK
jgi:hypothetical protein